MCLKFLIELEVQRHVLFSLMSLILSRQIEDKVVILEALWTGVYLSHMHDSN